MNFDLILAILVYVIFLIYYKKNKEKFTKQGIAILYKTKLGLNLMEKLAKKYPKLLNFLSYFSIALGFFGMAYIFYILIGGVYKLILGYLKIIPEPAPVVAPVLPGINIVPGLPPLGFWHWILGILVVTVVHELAHGIYSKLYKINVKSSGFAFFGPIPAAFVEPDEKKLKKISTKKQLTILSAGAFFNVVFGILVLLFYSFVFTQAISTVDVTIVHVEPGSPANLSGLYPGLVVKEVNGIEINSRQHLVDEIQKSEKNTIIKMITDKGNFYVKPDLVDDKPKIGVNVQDARVIRPDLPFFVKWINMFLYWVFIFSIGIGLFNLLPLGPIDGGRMFYVSSLKIMSKKTAFKVLKFITAFSIALVFINFLPWLIKGFRWILGLFS